VIDEDRLVAGPAGGSVIGGIQSAEAVEDDASPTVALEELERLTIQRVFDKVSGNKARLVNSSGSAAQRFTATEALQIPSIYPPRRSPS